MVDPAYAGMILRGRNKDNGRRSGPRVCGDDPDPQTMAGAANEWTPRMRG